MKFITRVNSLESSSPLSNSPNNDVKGYTTQTHYYTRHKDYMESHSLLITVSHLEIIQPTFALFYFNIYI